MKRFRVPSKPNSRGKNGSSKEPIKVFCRVRPLKNASDVSCITMISPTIVQLSPPESAFGYRNGGAGKAMQYIFKQVFDEEANQKLVFETVALPLVENLLQGKNGLLFTYGVTGSGKTFTMTGTPEESGIMPRCLDVIFNSISERQAKKFIFKPDRLNGFELQGEADALAERQAEFISHVTSSKSSRFKLTKKESDPDLAGRIADPTRLNVNKDSSYAVFVTYIEVYNNSAYDLLEDAGDDSQRPKPLQMKIVREDSSHNMYVHGVTELEVGSSEEAFEIFCKGQKRKRMAHTVLNTESSRSHSAFTIRLVQTVDEKSDSEDSSRKTVGVAQLSLVDLAGSERTNRTKNTGQRLREAGNINNSLMTLRTCLELLRENQLTGSNKMIPYRESKLTHLFRNYLEGEGQVSMIVCVNPHVDDYDETIHVLKFAEMSQEVQVTCPTPFRINLYVPGPKRNQGFKHRLDLDSEETESDDMVIPKKSRINITPRLFTNLPKLEVVGPRDDESILSLTAYLDANAEQMVQFIEGLNNKQEELLQHLTKTERESGIIGAEAQALKALLDKEKVKNSNLETKLASAETHSNFMKRKLDDCEEHVKKLKFELTGKEHLLTRRKMEGEKVKEHYSSRMVQVQERMKNELEKKLRSQKSALEMEVRNKENKLQEVKRILSDEYLTPRGPPPSSRYKTPQASTPSLQSITPAVTSSSARRPGGAAVSNRRHRRSKSAGDVWLEHKPAAAVPLNTVLQPQMKKRKSVTKLTDIRDVTGGTDKYCLMTQNQDSEGDLETRLYKGDVIPTSGGGAQVMFNDVEVLKQISPNVTPPRRRRPRGVAKEDIQAACSVAIEGRGTRV